MGVPPPETSWTDEERRRAESGRSILETAFFLQQKQPTSSSAGRRESSARGFAKGLLRRRKERPTRCRCTPAPLRPAFTRAGGPLGFSLIRLHPQSCTGAAKPKHPPSPKALSSVFSLAVCFPVPPQRKTHEWQGSLEPHLDIHCCSRAGLGLASALWVCPPWWPQGSPCTLQLHRTERKHRPDAAGQDDNIGTPASNPVSI